MLPRLRELVRRANNATVVAQIKAYVEVEGPKVGRRTRWVESARGGNKVKQDDQKEGFFHGLCCPVQAAPEIFVKDSEGISRPLEQMSAVQMFDDAVADHLLGTGADATARRKTFWFKRRQQLGLPGQENDPYFKDQTEQGPNGG